MEWLVGFLGFAVVTLILSYLFFRELYLRRLKSFSEELLKAVQDSENGEKLVSGSDHSFADVYEGFSTVIKHLRKHEMEKQELLNIISSIAGNMEFEKMLETLMPGLLRITQSTCGAFYLLNQGSNKLQIKYSHGFSKNLFSEFDMPLGEGFFGADFVSREVRIFKDVPEDTLYVMRTFLGKIKPKSIMVVPIVTQEALTGAVVLSSIYNYTEENVEMIELVKYYVGVAVGNGITYEKTKRLTNELKFQNKLIQNLNEDLETKVSERIIFLNNIIDCIQDYAIYAMDKNGIVLAWNKGAERLFGYSSDELMGKNVEVIYSEEEIKSGKVKNRIETVLRDGKYIETGWRIRKDGSRCYVDVMISGMYDQKGNIIGMTNVTCDVTDMRALEDALSIEKEFTQRILESSEHAILLTDDRGIVRTANTEAETVLRSDQLLGHGLFEFFEDSLECKEALLGIAKGSSRREWECKVRGQSGTVRIHAEILSGESDTHKIFIRIDP